MSLGRLPSEEIAEIQRQACTNEVKVVEVEVDRAARIVRIAGREVKALVGEVDIEIFEAGMEIVGESVLDAAADRPTSDPVAVVDEGTIKLRIADKAAKGRLHEGRTTRDIEERLILQEASAAADRCNVIDVELGGFGRILVLGNIAIPGPVAFDAHQDVVVELVIEAAEDAATPAPAAHIGVVDTATRVA